VTAVTFFAEYSGPNNSKKPISLPWMALKALDVLRNGLKKLEKQIGTRKKELETRLAEKKSISSQDEKWLDQEANLVDERQVLDALEKASDYERGLDRLDDKQKGLVRKLREVAGDLAKVVGKKRKRACSCDPSPLTDH
jgi:hypothetical protein